MPTCLFFLLCLLVFFIKDLGQLQIFPSETKLNVVLFLNAVGSQFFLILPSVACLLANCERFSARCETTQGGLAQCICPSVQNCRVVPDTVCANDSRVYTTECHMNVQACQLRRALSVVKRGTCSKYFICYWCRHYSKSFTSLGYEHFDELSKGKHLINFLHNLDSKELVRVI